MIPNRRGITTETKANNYLRIHSIHAIQFHDFLGALNINELLSFYTAIKLQVCSHPVIKRWDWGPGVSPIVKRGVILTPPPGLWTEPVPYSCRLCPCYPYHTEFASEVWAVQLIMVLFRTLKNWNNYVQLKWSQVYLRFFFFWNTLDPICIMGQDSNTTRYMPAIPSYINKDILLSNVRIVQDEFSKLL